MPRRAQHLYSAPAHVIDHHATENGELRVINHHATENGELRVINHHATENGELGTELHSKRSSESSLRTKNHEIRRSVACFVTQSVGVKHGVT